MTFPPTAPVPTDVAPRVAGYPDEPSPDTGHGPADEALPAPVLIQGMGTQQERVRGLLLIQGTGSPHRYAGSVAVEVG